MESIRSGSSESGSFDGTFSLADCAKFLLEETCLAGKLTQILRVRKFNTPAGFTKKGGPNWPPSLKKDTGYR